MKNDIGQSKRRFLSYEQKLELIAAFQSGELTQREFAAKHGIGLSTLGNWLRRERKVPHSSARARLIEVEVQSPRRDRLEDWFCYCVDVPQGSSLRIRAGFDASEVQQLLQVIQKL